MKTFKLGALLAACGLALSVAAVSAAPVLHITDGVLDGASGVIVNGVSYEATFTDGTCISLFNGCTDDSQFPFTTESVARDAMTALIDQVWGTSWGAGNIRGCTLAAYCFTVLPLRMLGSGNDVVVLMYANYPDDSLDALLNSVTTNSQSFEGNGVVNYVVWTPSDDGTGAGRVPEPASFGLAALALGIAGATGRRRRRVSFD